MISFCGMGILDIYYFKSSAMTLQYILFYQSVLGAVLFYLLMLDSVVAFNRLTALKLRQGRRVLEIKVYEHCSGARFLPV